MKSNSQPNAGPRRKLDRETWLAEAIRLLMIGQEERVDQLSDQVKKNYEEWGRTMLDTYYLDDYTPRQAVAEELSYG